MGRSVLKRQFILHLSLTLLSDHRWGDPLFGDSTWEITYYVTFKVTDSQICQKYLNILWFLMFRDRLVEVGIFRASVWWLGACFCGPTVSCLSMKNTLHSVFRKLSCQDFWKMSWHWWVKREKKTREAREELKMNVKALWLRVLDWMSRSWVIQADGSLRL